MKDKTIGQYLRIVRDWWWVLLAGALLPAGVSYYLSSRQPDFYQASATLMVGTSLESANPDLGVMNTSRTLADAYAKLVLYDPITEAVVERLDLQRSPAQLASQISTVVDASAQLLEIRVIDTNPQAAALIANAVAEELIAYTPTANEAQQTEAAFTRQQLDDLRARIARVQSDVQELTASMSDLSSAAELADAQERLGRLRELESLYQSTYARLLYTYSGNSPNTLRLFDPAVEPHSPLPRRTAMLAGLAGAAGLGLALGAALLIEYLDDTVRWEGELRQSVAGLPVLGSIVQVRKKVKLASHALLGDPRSAEMVRSLRTSIFLAAGKEPLRSLLISSPGARDGKTFITAQLGLAIAGSGKRVIMLDADLRRPSLHECFDLPNVVGLSDLLAGRSSLAGSTGGPTGGPMGGSTWLKRIEGVPNLYLLPAGKPPSDPTSLLASPRLVELLEALKLQAALVLVDAPPEMVGPDVALLAAISDGTVLVVSAGTTSLGRTLKTAEHLARQGSAKLLGIVFNRVKIDGDRAYYAYHYGARPVRRRRTFLDLLSPPRSGENGTSTFGLAEAAEYLGVSRATARRWCESGRLPAARKWFNWRIAEHELKEMAGQIALGRGS